MTHAIRPPQTDLSFILDVQNPRIDLKQEAYESSTRNFVKAVADYTNHAITEVTNRRNAHLAEKKKLVDRTQAVEAETNNCKMKEIELIAGKLIYSTAYCSRCYDTRQRSTENERRRRRLNCLYLLSDVSLSLSKRRVHHLTSKLNTIGQLQQTSAEVSIAYSQLCIVPHRCRKKP